jgi:PAS domain S-box-containing protein
MTKREEGAGKKSVTRRGAYRAELISSARAHRIRYQEFFEFAPDCHLITDARGLILEANHAAAALLDCRKEFLVDKPLGLFVMPGLRTRFYVSLARLISDGSDAFDTRLRWRGEASDVSIRVMASHDLAGVTSFRWMIRDLTEPLKIEAARKELLQQLEPRARAIGQRASHGQ